MLYWLRVLYIVLYQFFFGPSKPTLKHGEDHKFRFTCTPYDIDLNFHMNNSVYNTAMELARWQMSFESGWYHAANKLGVYWCVGGQSFQYRRQVKLFETIEVSTKWLGHDEKWMYFEHTMTKVKNGHFVGRGVARVAMVDLKKHSSVNPEAILKVLYGDDFKDTTVLSDQVKTFAEHDLTLKEVK